MYLEKISSPHDLKKLSHKQLEKLAQEVREFLIENISKTGGHFSSNLGVVELTIALHYLFDSPQDKFIFDVGHQCYVHKILTGRQEQFHTLRQYNGLSGFQKRNESIHDTWEAGHSSTSISAGIGMAIAKSLNNETGDVLAIVGDAAMMSGESFEALNHLGSLKSKVIVVLNDNEMSISQNVGGLTNFLSELRYSAKYNHAKHNYIGFLNKTQFGKKIYKITKYIKDGIKHNVLEDNIFHEFGLDYIGPVNGHEFKDLINAFTLAKEMDHSVVVHVHTQKGQGYYLAETDKKGVYHGVSPFDSSKGISTVASQQDTWSHILAGHVQKWMRQDEDIVTLTPAMISGSCLEGIFKEFPKRSFDVGIAEEHAMTLAAGLSASNKKPFITVYSSFIQRAYDQINHDVARMNLPCFISIDRAGLVGSDGETHHGVFDIGFLAPIPNLTIMTPKDSKEMKMMVNTIFSDFSRPYVLRFPRGVVENSDVDLESTIEIGTWTYEIESNTAKTVVITYDHKVTQLKAEIEKENLDVELINARFIKPLDENVLTNILNRKQKVVVYETDIKCGSLGSMISTYYSNKQEFVEIYNYAIDDHYTPQGTVPQLLEHEKLSVQHIMDHIKEIIDAKGKN